MSRALIETIDITKTYTMGDVQVHALRGVSLRVEEGELMSIMGPSGSGKSTMMNVLGCLDQPSSGEYYLDGTSVGELYDNDLADIRNRKIGFVFQTFNLLSRTTAFQNVELPLIYRGASARERHSRGREALGAVGLTGWESHTPSELSGGQQQRVAIARAMIINPEVLLADEPTGNLDSTCSREIMELLCEFNKQRGITIVMVTHDPEMARYSQRTIRFLDGLIDSEEHNGEDKS